MAGEIATAFVVIRPETKGFKEQATRDLESPMRGVGTRVAAAFAAGFIIRGAAKSVFVEPIKQAGDFEQSLNVLWATADHGKATLSQVSATAIKLGNDTKLPAVSAKDAADAMLELAKGGFTAQESMKAARGTLLLATAAQIDNAQAAEIEADALHAFGLKAGEAARVTDLLAGAANRSTTGVPQIALALSQVGASAHALNIPIQDTVAAITQLANAGIKGSDAGTSLKTALQRLIPSTKQAKDEADKLGVTEKDSHGNFVGLDSIIKQYHDSLSKLSPVARAQAINTIFGSDAARAANVIFAKSPAIFDANRKAVEKRGQAQALATAQTKGFNGAEANLMNTLQTLQLEIGLKLLPVATRFTNWLAGEVPRVVKIAVGWWNEMKTPLGQIEGIFAHDLPGALKPLEAEFGFLSGAVGDNTSVVKDAIGWAKQHEALLSEIAGAVTVFASSLITLLPAIKVVTTAIGLLNVVMDANPITLVVIAIALLAGGLYLLYQRSATARAIMNAAFADIKRVAQDALGWITTVGIPELTDQFNRLEPIVEEDIRLIIGDLQSIVGWVRANWTPIWSVLGPVVKTNVAIVKTELHAVLDIVADIARLIDNAIHGKWGAVWGNLKDIVKVAVQAAMSVAITLIKGQIELATAAAKLVAKGIVAGIKWAASGLAGLAGDLWAKLKAEISQVAGQAYTGAIDIGVDLVKGIIHGIENAPVSIGKSLWGAVKGATDFAKIKAKINSPSKYTADELGSPIIEGLEYGMQHAKISTTLGDTLSQQIREAVTAGKRNLQSQLSSLTSDINTVMDAATARITNPLSDTIAAHQTARQLRDLTAARDAAQAAKAAGPQTTDTDSDGNPVPLTPDRAAKQAAALNQTYMDAQQDLDDFNLQAQIDAANKANTIAQSAADQQILIWQNQFNTGKITQQAFLDDITTIVNEYAGSDGLSAYQNMGDLLGQGFADAFTAHLNDIIDQVAQITAGGQAEGGAALGADAPGQVSGPLADQLATARKKLTTNNTDLSKAKSDIKVANERLAAEVAAATGAKSAGGAKITTAEQATIDTTKKRIATDQATINANTKLAASLDDLIATLAPLVKQANAVQVGTITIDDPAVTAAILAATR